MTARDVLGGLHRAHVAKFDELCTLYASHLGYSSNPTKLSDEQREQIAEDVEELTENWDEAPCFDDWEDRDAAVARGAPRNWREHSRSARQDMSEAAASSSSSLMRPSC